jgi:tetratricopeptide (TPR) repeat protein
MGVLNAIQPEPEYDDANWRIWAQLEPHLKTFAERLQEFDVDLDAGPLLGAYATWLTYAARYGAAERFYRQAAGIAARRSGPSSVAVATQLTGLMSALLGRNKVAEAEAVARRALDIFAADPQPEGNSCHCLNILGEIVRATRPHEAIDLFQRAISCSQALLGPSHPHTMACAHNLASVLLATGQIDKAEPILADLLPAFERAFGENHPNVAGCLNELGECARRTGRYTDAAQLYRRAIEILEGSYGTDHPVLASSLSNLGLTLGSLGLAAEAETLFTRALSIDGNCLGWNDPKVANRLGNLAWLFKRTWRSAEAEAYARQAVKILLIYKAREHYDHANWASVWKQYTDLLTERGLDAPAIDAAYQELLSELAET